MAASALLVFRHSAIFVNILGDDGAHGFIDDARPSASYARPNVVLSLAMLATYDTRGIGILTA